MTPMVFFQSPGGAAVSGIDDWPTPPRRTIRTPGPGPFAVHCRRRPRRGRTAPGFEGVHGLTGVEPRAAPRAVGWGFIVLYALGYTGTWLALLTPSLVSLALRLRQLSP